MQKKESIRMEEAMEDGKRKVCQDCGNIYKIVWLKRGDDYNDFGFRHCPFCGVLTDEYAHIGRYVKK